MEKGVSDGFGGGCGGSDGNGRSRPCRQRLVLERGTGYCFRTLRSAGRERVMEEPRDQSPATPGRHLRASHADREQVIGTLKAAFVHGRLARDEFGLRWARRWRRGPAQS